MQSRPENGTPLEPESHGVPQSTFCSQPWWRGVGYNTIPTVSADSPSKSSVDVPNGAASNKTSQCQAASLDDGAGVSKENQTMTTQSGSDASYVREHQNLQHGASAVTPVMTEYVLPHTQLELGQTIACPSYPYSDPYYGGILTAYGTQALVHPHILGLHQARMPLPLEMTEEPVYVNAKQYHGILRRRQSRAKAELEKKLIKARKPYLHESRHQHAMRRARGNGGRFLNTKKLDSSAANAKSDDTDLAPLRPPGSSERVLEYSSLGTRPETKGGSTMSQDMCGSYPYSTNGNNGCYPHHRPGLLSAFHSHPGERGEEGDCSGQQRGGILASRPAVAI